MHVGPSRTLNLIYRGIDIASAIVDAVKIRAAHREAVKTLKARKRYILAAKLEQWSNDAGGKVGWQDYAESQPQLAKLCGLKG